MRKTLVAFFVSILAIPIYSAVLAQEITADSRITQVTVYPDSVLVTRTAGLKLSSGAQKVIFPEIIPQIDENSLRVSANPVEGVKILGAQVKKEFLQEESAEKVKQLQDELQGLNDEKRRLELDRQAIAEEKQFLDSVRLFSQGQLPKELVTKMPAAKDLDDTLKFLGTRLKENYNKAMDSELASRDLQKKIEVVQRKLTQVSGPGGKLKRSIEVELEVSKPMNLDLSASYLVYGASWQPLYDARASVEKSKVELIAYGLIKQNTGEDWQDVKIFLSTARPSVGGRMPEVSPWFIRPFQPVMMYDKLDAKRMKASAPMQTMEGALLSEKQADNTWNGKEAEKYAKAEEKGVAVIYELPRKASVKSDGTEYKLPVSAQDLVAAYEYSAYPRLAPYAYLGSRVTNAKDLQLLSGRVNIFLEGDFVGLSSIDNIGPGEEFDLYLGVDENVKIKREQIEKKVDETLLAGIPSPTKKTTYTYKLTIENYKSKKINAKLFEAIPVSQDDRIKVKVNQVSLEPKVKDWKDKKGVWLWELVLEPKQKQEITYTYVVEHPREMQVEGL
ncbi:MAG: mucoidy inhibitor MuiA family protein [Candidatus Omnitrophica bacterium]|nr:mucoidy inhibitor MuiA family protein [Candidatus Omnitrophota bacterium]